MVIGCGEEGIDGFGNLELLESHETSSVQKEHLALTSENQHPVA